MGSCGVLCVAELTVRTILLPDQHHRWTVTYCLRPVAPQSLHSALTSCRQLVGTDSCIMLTMLYIVICQFYSIY